ncbi:DEAD/DEAH box helicase [Brachybacterium saurashtrense]|uniref:RNA helicase n=1 Tax=Brachybacterium saurashtrense TaxID=556288 RepID=A0A345YL83_9MICO|nr:DEAD/DEAH box helicase [Brachybacterium saurashtrense]AXK44685.1 ATP-dependent helicase [Brachybacterium saurashtrense]RRR23297.1 ATP-dependent helicase [Brachybacterium saurashtrense]
MPETIPHTDEAVSASPAVEQSSGTPDPQKTFADFDVRADIVEALAAKGITTPFPIQALTLPVALRGRDIIGQAKTGTGKTLGFGIPLLQNSVAPGEPNPQDRPIGRPQALVVLPTRELAVQVAHDLETASAKRPIRILTVYGGRAYEPQIEALEKGVEVVVGTPGRLIDLMRQKHLDLSQVRTAVLDEADEMLDLGFLEDIEKLLQAVPTNRQTMLFSATMPGPIMALARRFMLQPTHIRAHDPGDEARTKADIKQVVYRAHQLDKIEVMARVLQARGRGLSIIFMRTKRQADRVAGDLADRGFAAAPLHGDLGQGAREQALRAFRNGKIDVLVATDVAARGIDVTDVTHVVNWNCPDDDKTYLHRTGRTGRAGKKGTAITFVDWEDLARWGLIARQLGLESTEAVETYSTSDHLFTDLDIPTDAKGTLPKDRRTREGLDAEEIEDLGGPDAAGRAPRGEGRGGRESGRGGRDRGGRGEGRSRGARRGGGEARGESDGGPREDAPARDEAGGESSERPRRQRSRSRTRRVHGEVVGGDGAGGEAPSNGPGDEGDSSESGGGSSNRRRRSRGGRGRSRSRGGSSNGGSSHGGSEG